MSGGAGTETVIDASSVGTSSRRSRPSAERRPNLIAQTIFRSTIGRQRQGGHDMPELESELRVLLDKQALYELLIRYARGVDRNDKAMVLACFHPDAFLHYNTYQGRAV